MSPSQAEMGANFIWNKINMVMTLKHLPTDSVIENDIFVEHGVKTPGGIGKYLYPDVDNMIEVRFLEQLIVFTAQFPEIEFEVKLTVKHKGSRYTTRYVNE